MKATIKVFLFCMLFISLSAQTQAEGNLRSLQYAFNRADGTNNEITYKTIYICLYGGTKSGWNAKAQADYPLETKIIYSKIFRLTDVPQFYDPKNNNVYLGLRKLFLDHLIAMYGFNEDINYVTYVADYDLNYVEKKLSETMDQQIKFNMKINFQYDSKFSFNYSDVYYKVEYKDQ